MSVELSEDGTYTGYVSSFKTVEGPDKPMVLLLAGSWPVGASVTVRRVTPQPQETPVTDDDQQHALKALAALRYALDLTPELRETAYQQVRAAVAAANQRAEQAEAERDVAHAVIRRYEAGWCPSVDTWVRYTPRINQFDLVEDEPMASSEAAAIARALVADQPEDGSQRGRRYVHPDPATQAQQVAADALVADQPATGHRPYGPDYDGTDECPNCGGHWDDRHVCPDPVAEQPASPEESDI